jgi:Tol biopolymer transport system component
MAMAERTARTKTESADVLRTGLLRVGVVAPGGRRIASAVRDSGARTARLITIDVASGAEQAFDARFTQMGYNAWLPDGTGIAFVATPTGVFAAQGGGQIFVQPFPSGEPRRLTNDLVDYRVATFSADGQSLVTIGADTTRSLWQIPLDGREPRRINSQRYDGLYGLAVRPDGRLLISMSGGATIGIWRMNADGANEQLLAEVPDATYLSLAADDRTLYFTSSMNGAPGTWRLSLDGGAPVLVSAAFDRAAVSRDGRALAGMYRAADQFKPAVLRLDAGGTIQTFDSPSMTGAGGVVQWTADGSGILYTAAERANLWLQRLSGGPAVRVTNIEDLSITFYRAAPPIDRRTVIVARGTQSRDAILITNFR